MQKTLLAAVLASGCAMGALVSAPAHAQAEQRSYDIAAQPLGDALHAYSQTSGRQVIFDAEIARGKRSASLRGRFFGRYGLVAPP